MVGDDCDADWLGHHLMAGDGGTDGSDAGGEEGSVLVLDCRSLAEYRAGHIVGAIHLTIPTLMLRRLRTGCLPVESVINCQDARERFSRHWKTKTLVLLGTDAEGPKFSRLTDHGKCNAGGDKAAHAKCTLGYEAGEEGTTEDAVGLTEGTTEDAVGLTSLLFSRLREDGCTVRCLRGGFAAFSVLYPELCTASQEKETTILGLGCLRLSDSGSSSGSEDPTARGPGTDSDPSSPDNTSHFPVEVLPNLYLGNAKNSADFENLYKNGIKYILNVTPNVPNKFENSEQFQYLQLPICDHWSQNMTAYFPQAIAFIEEARRKKCGVLVHCLAGISRSVTITVAYLMHSLSLSLNDAYDHVKRCKPNISPNFNFMGQLLDYERTLRLQRDMAPPSECRCRLGLPGECGCNSPASLDSGGEDLSTPCTCGIDRMAHFSSPACSSLSSLSTGGATSSSSSTSCSAFNYELPPSSHT